MELITNIFKNPSFESMHPTLYVSSKFGVQKISHTDRNNEKHNLLSFDHLKTHISSKILAKIIMIITTYFSYSVIGWYTKTRPVLLRSER